MKTGWTRLLYALPSLFTAAVVACNIRRIHLSIGSLLVLFVVAVMLLQYFIYRSDDPSDTGFYGSSSLGDEQKEKQVAYMHRFARILLSMLPLHLIFILLIPSDLLKGVGAVGVELLSFLVNSIVNAVKPIK